MWDSGITVIDAQATYGGKFRVYATAVQRQLILLYTSAKDWPNRELSRLNYTFRSNFRLILKSEAEYPKIKERIGEHQKDISTQANAKLTTTRKNHCKIFIERRKATFVGSNTSAQPEHYLLIFLLLDSLTPRAPMSMGK